MKQVFHPFYNWEEYHYKMWDNFYGDEHLEYLKAAIEFTGNAKVYGYWMLEVVKLWPISCEQNLSDISLNRQAWVGHAACCLAIGCPESITRQAWHELTQQQQDDANAMADKAIKKWEYEYHKKLEKECLNDQLGLTF